MGLKLFFANIYWLEEKGIYREGFRLYSLGHILWLLGIVAFIILISRHYKRQDRKGRERLKKFFAVFLIGSEIVIDTILAFYGAPMEQYLPFHLCSLAMFVMLIDAYFPKQKLMGQLMAYAFMPGAVCAELFCSWTIYPFNSIMNMFSFLFHCWIMVYLFMQYHGGEIRPTYKGLWQTILTLAILAVPIYFFDKETGLNYFFMNKPAEGSPLVGIWEIFGTRFGMVGYILGAFAVVIFVLHLLYGMYATIDRIKDKQVKGAGQNGNF